jgi:hypothetical protein
MLGNDCAKSASANCCVWGEEDADDVGDGPPSVAGDTNAWMDELLDAEEIAEG